MRIIRKSSNFSNIRKPIIRKAAKKNFSRSKDEVREAIIENGIATEEECDLVTDICGYSLKALNDIIEVRTGYEDIEQYLGEDEEDEDEFACGKKRINNSQKPIIRKNASKKNFGYSDWRFQAKVDEWNEKEHSYDETVAHFGWDFLEGYCERSNNYDKMPESMDQFIQFLEDSDYDDDTMARLADSFDKEDDYVYVNKDGKYDSLKEKELDEYFVDVIPASGFNGFERWAKACGIKLDA